MKRRFGGHDTQADPFPVSHTDEEWRQRLDPAQFQVLRKHATERAGTSPLNAEKRPGTFLCAGCRRPLFASDTRFESRCRQLPRPIGAWFLSGMKLI